MKVNTENIKSAADNIARYFEKEVSLAERMSANFSELASFVANAAAKDARTKDFFIGDSPLEMYIPTLSDPVGFINNALEQNSSLVRAKAVAAEGAYVADFCAKVTEKLKANSKIKPSVALFAEPASKLPGNSVAFAESQVLIAAFSKFQKRNTPLTPSYVRSFNDACEDVSSGICDYCILPIENSREGALLTVYGLIERHELFITSVCSVESNEITTKFALLCREFRGIIDTLSPQNLDLRIYAYDQLLWSQIYTGANVLNVKFVKTVAVPLGYTDGYAHICTFSASGETLFAFLLFLSTIRADYTIIGTYEEEYEKRI